MRSLAVALLAVVGSGEPALGPPGFPHRLSALPNPIAPVTHHWLDSTHISFGYVTTGVYGPGWKVEGSILNGREPDGARTGLELAPLDSSGRVAFAHGDGLVLQVSAAHLHRAEEGVGRQPRTDVNRLTASVIYQRRVAGDGLWATRTAKLRIEVPNANQQLRLGMYADVQIRTTSATSQLAVPRSAVQQVGDRTVVYLNDPGQETQFVEREVQVSSASNNQIIVLSGLTAKDLVVSEGSFFLRAERERLGLRPRR
jgi:hypothetical protein